MFKTSLGAADPFIAASIARESSRQAGQIELIASENIVSKAIIEAQGSVLTSKYAEGYPSRHYYGGRGIVSCGTQSHLILVDLRPKGVKGNAAEAALERAGFTCNKNGVPGEPEKATVTSGVRLGTAAGCSRGFGPEEFRKIGHLISDVLDALAKNPDGDALVESSARKQVSALGAAFPIY